MTPEPHLLTNRNTSPNISLQIPIDLLSNSRIFLFVFQCLTFTHFSFTSAPLQLLHISSACQKQCVEALLQVQCVPSALLRGDVFLVLKGDEGLVSKVCLQSRWNEGSRCVSAWGGQRRIFSSSFLLNFTFLRWGLGIISVFLMHLGKLPNIRWLCLQEHLRFKPKVLLRIDVTNILVNTDHDSSPSSANYLCAFTANKMTFWEG